MEPAATSPEPPLEASAAPEARRPRRELLLERLERLSTPRAAVLALLFAGLGAVIVFVARPTYPNYDSYYTLLWGQDLAAGRTPDYDVFRTPTPHPLSTLFAALLSPLGAAADRTLVLLALGFHVALLALLFRFTQLLLGTFVAALAVVVLLTRTDLEFFTLRAMVDVPFLALVFGAAVLELRSPRRGTSVLVLLALAGLLRPEAWVLAGLYVLWLAPAVGIGGVIRYGLLAAVGPVVWALADFAATGDPLYSLTSTREVAGQFGRQRSPIEAALLLPDFVGGSEKLVNVIAGGLGGLLALTLLRWRAALPLALALIGMGVFLGIAGVGLSVIPRYLLIPSLVFNLCVAVALGGGGPGAGASTARPGDRARGRHARARGLPRAVLPERPREAERPGAVRPRAAPAARGHPRPALGRRTAAHLRTDHRAHALGDPGGSLPHRPRQGRHPSLHQPASPADARPPPRIGLLQLRARGRALHDRHLGPALGAQVVVELPAVGLPARGREQPLGGVRALPVSPRARRTGRTFHATLGDSGSSSVEQRARRDVRTVRHPPPDEIELTAVLHALSDPVRLRIVQRLSECDGEPCCNALAEGISRSTLSHHLKVLREAGLTRTRMCGTQRFVSLREDELSTRLPGLLDSVLEATAAAA